MEPILGCGSPIETSRELTGSLMFDEILIAETKVEMGVAHLFGVEFTGALFFSLLVMRYGDEKALKIVECRKSFDVREFIAPDDLYDVVRANALH